MRSDARTSGVARTRGATAAALVALALVPGLHALRPAVDPVSRRLSEYAIGPWGWLMTVAFGATACGAWLLRAALPATTAARPARVLLTFATIGFGVSAVFPTDPGTPEGVHETVHTRPRPAPWSPSPRSRCGP